MTQTDITALTEREHEIIILLADGLTNKEIANQLFLAPSTVKWYVRQLNSKLYTDSREAIVEAAERMGVLDQTDYGTDAPKHSLPYQTTPFIGRDAELDEIRALIENDNIRLLTILAQGGMGKTRIALEATEQQMNNFPHGVYFVPLQPLSDIANIVPQIATVTGLQFSNDGTAPRQQLLEFLSDKTMLLCLDNWEHLLEGAPLVNEILSAAPHVKMIATSREKLNLMGESVYVLKSMQFPTWETPADALEYDAVQLLVQAAQRVKTDWAVTDENLKYVARVCRLTQGMPLGILLAASWLDVYSLERIGEEIDKNVDILESDMRDIPERQRSIRAVFEYAWDKLKPQEQDVLMKISVFRGGCSPSAVETITGANARTLQALVNKALLIRNKQGRYDIHELLRQYAGTYLNQTEAGDTVRDSHMTYYANAVYERETHLQDERQLDAVHAISEDFENMRVAWLRATDHKHFDLINKMQFALQVYVQFRPRYNELNELFAIASAQLERHTADISPLIRARIEIGRAQANNLLGKYVDAEPFLRSALATLRKREDTEVLAYGLGILCFNLINQHQHHEALQVGLEGYQLCEQIDWSWCAGIIAHLLSYLYGINEEREQAHHYVFESFRLRSDIGDTYGIQEIMNNLSIVMMDQGDPDAALAYLHQGLEMSRQLGIWRRVAIMAAHVANHELENNNNLELAEQYANESLQASLAVHNKAFRTLPHRVLSTIALIQDDINTAVYHAEHSLRLARLGAWNLLQSSRMVLSLTYALAGQYADARKILLDYFQDNYIQIRENDLTTSVIAFAIITANDGNHVYAIELLGFVLDDTLEYEYFNKFPAIRAFQAELRQTVGDDTYNAAFQRGKSLDAQTIIERIINELSED